MQFSSLTIGRRIALGFSLVLILLGAVATTAWLALGSSGRRLSLYAGSTEETNNVAGVESAMLGVKLSVNEFLASGSAASADSYKQAKSTLDSQIQAALTSITDPVRAAASSERRDARAPRPRALPDRRRGHDDGDGGLAPGVLVA